MPRWSPLIPSTPASSNLFPSALHPWVLALLNAQCLHLTPSQQFVIENGLRNEHCGKYIGNQTDRQGNRKPLHRAFAEKEEEAARHHRGDVRIDDGPPGFIE